MASVPKTYITPQQYLEVERKSPTKHEYYRGETFAMAGASREHVLLVGNVVTTLNSQLRDKRCEVYSNDMRVRIPSTGLYTYPDVIVACGNPEFDDDMHDTLLNPIVIVEVLSESTESYDRGEKFAQYRTIESLKEYLLVSQEQRRLEQFIRQPDDSWLLRSWQDDAACELISIRAKLNLSDVYAKVQLPPPREYPDGIIGPKPS